MRLQMMGGGKKKVAAAATVREEKFGMQLGREEELFFATFHHI